MSWKPNISALEGDRVRFEDGNTDQIDIIGYEYMKTFRGEERPISSIYELAQVFY